MVLPFLDTVLAPNMGLIVILALIVISILVSLLIGFFAGLGTQDEIQRYGARVEDLPSSAFPTSGSSNPHRLVDVPHPLSHLQACDVCHGVGVSLTSDCPGKVLDTGVLLSVAYGLLDFRGGIWTIRPYHPGEERDVLKELDGYRAAKALNAEDDLPVLH